MRTLILAALCLLGWSGIGPSLAQEPAKPAIEVPQTTVPGRSEQNADQPRDQRAGRDQSRAEDRTVGPNWRMRRGDDRDTGEIVLEDRMRRGGHRMDRDDREMGRGQRMSRDGERGRYAEREDRDWDRGQSAARGDRDSDYADRGEERGYSDEDRPRRRVKICIEYANGDEYCRYRR